MRVALITSRLFPILRGAGFSGLLYGVALGCAVGFGVSLAVATVGLPALVVTGLLLAAALFMDFAWRRTPATRTRERLLPGVCLLGWLALSTSLAELSLTVAGTQGLTGFGSVLAGVLVGATCIGLPIYLGTAAVPQNVSGWFSVAAGAALSLATLSFLPATVDLRIVVLAAISLATGTEILARVRKKQISVSDKEPHTPPAPQSVPGDWKWLPWVALPIGGAAVAVSIRVLNQTMPAGLYWGLSGLAAIVLFTAAGLAFSRGRIVSALGSAPVAAALAALSLFLMVSAFPEIVMLQLRLNANVHNPNALLILRAVMVTAWLAPHGLLFGAALRQLREQQPSRLAFPASVTAVGFVAALAAMPVGTQTLSAFVVIMLTVVALLAVRQSTRAWWPAERTKRIGVVAAMLPLCCLPFLNNRLRVDESAQLLFSSTVFQEYANGTSTDLLRVASDARLVRIAEDANGVTSEWRLGGGRVQVRQNGIPVGDASFDPRACPQSALATLPVVLPLLMHESPQNVLLLGDAGPAAEATTLVFPIQSVTAVGRRTRTATEVDEYYSERRNEDRFKEISADPAIAIVALRDTYDIILSRPPQAALPGSGPYHTTEFYRRAATRLAADGLFCQTFRQIDFGSEPIRCVLKSLRDVFPVVSAVQLERGEILLVATTGSTVVSPGMAERASRVHVRHILDDLGWDWSRPLKLATLDSEAVDALLSTWDVANTSSNIAFLRGLPLETMRWGDKPAEIRRDIGGFQRRILDQLEEGDYRDEAARRIQELGVEAEVLFGFPDVPWMYRKTLKTRMEQNPRPPQEVVVKGEVKRQLHATDKYRIEYLKALSEAIKSARSDPAALVRLEQFTAPTEPLLSYFASHEAARIHASLKAAPESELRHRLRTIYFAPAGTRSVRDVTAAINLLIEHPDTVPDPGRRWDQMNSLLQILMARWSARSNIPPSSSSVVLNDIDKCLLAIDRAIDAMGDWRGDAGINAQFAEHRATYLRRRLERPLSRYRDELLPHHTRAASESMAAEDEVADTFRTLGN